MSTTPRITFIGMFEYDSHLFDNLSLPNDIDKDTTILTFLLQYGECPSLYTDVDFVKAALRLWSLKNEDSISRIYEALTAEYNPIHNFDRYEEVSETTDTSETTDYTGSETTGYTGSETTSYTGSEVTDYTGSETSTHTGSETTDYTGSETTSETVEGSTENKISAYNVSTYQPDTISNSETETNAEHERDLSETHTRNLTDTNTRNLKDLLNRSLTDTHNRNLTDSHNRNLKDTAKGKREFEHYGHLYGNIGLTTSQQMILAEIDLRENNSIYEIIATMLYRDFCLYYY